LKFLNSKGSIAKADSHRGSSKMTRFLPSLI